MISTTSSSKGPGHHRRQHSTPVVPFEAPAIQRPSMAGGPIRRAHRRGQTVDYGSFNPQLLSADRRHAPKTVPELRDYFNAKSGLSRQAQPAQQVQSYPQQAQQSQSFIQSSLSGQEDSYHACQPSWPWIREELQEFYQVSASGPCSSSASSVAPSLSRSASESSEKNSPLKSALFRMQQEQQKALPMTQQNGYGRSMQPLSVRLEAISPRMEPYPYNSLSGLPLTPDTTPMKSSFDLPMYSNEQTPSKSQSFSIPRTPISSEMQRAHSLHGLPNSSPVQVKQQIPSPAESPSVSFTEMAAMPSPLNFDVSATQSVSKHQKHSVSPASSPLPTLSEAPEQPVNETDLDSRVRASVRDTGVSSEKIAEFIAGPDPKDGKYVCLFDDCGSRFGRKENIKSHVQTHLDDRPYQCDVCDKLFVRGHDLKRHLKTHTGKKPFGCLCGASFARHDALTRHRQRDMCVGGVTGFVPKTTRRGRPPKKNRPDMETRQIKSTRTRQRAAEKAATVSSIKIEESVLQQAPLFNSPKYAPSSAMSSFTPPSSPGNAPSPTIAGNSLASQLEDDMLPPPMSPIQAAHTRYEQAIAQFVPAIASEQENLYSDRAVTPHDISSPHTAPTLDEYTSGSEIDLFITQDPSEQVRDEFANLTNSGLSEFPGPYSYMDTAGFPSSSFYSTFPEKTLSGLSTLDDVYADQIDTLSQQFLNDSEP